MNSPSKLLLLLALGIVWGMTIPMTKVAVSTGHQPLGLIFWQLVITIVALGIIVAIRRVKLLLTRQTLIYFFVIGMLGTLLPNSLSFIAAAQLPAGVMAIIIASVPMFSLAIALTLGVEVFSPMRVVGVLLGAAAVVLLVAPESSLPDPQKAIYVLIALIGPICYACEGNYIALRAPHGVDPLLVMLGASLVIMVVAAPLTAISDTWVDLSEPWGPPEWALLVSSLLHVVAYTSYIWLVGKAGPVFTSQIAYVVTIAGVFLSALMLGETYSNWVWAALGLMLAGLALVQPRRITKSAEVAK